MALVDMICGWLIVFVTIWQPSYGSCPAFGASSDQNRSVVKWIIAFIRLRGDRGSRM